MEIPVIRLREEELSDIPAVIQAHRSELSALGMVKLIAPRKLTTVPADFDMTIQTPIAQAVTGTGGVYKLNLVDIEPQSARLFSMFAKQEQPTETDYDVLEEKFWRGLSARRKMEAPIYGADVPGSLFDACNTSVSFQGGVKSLLQHLKKDIPGVNSPMLYFGTFGSMFGIHKEDMDLYSINYLHEGAPKQWYLIPPSQAHQVESVCHLEYPMDAQECSEFVRHKNCMLSPKLLQGYGINIYTARQEPGEFIVTFPRCYHFGFNFGANIAESVNFATPDWLEIGKRAKACTCSSTNVKIDVHALERAWRKATGEITPTPSSPQPKSSRVSPARTSRNIQDRFTTQREDSGHHQQRIKAPIHQLAEELPSPPSPSSSPAEAEPQMRKTTKPAAVRRGVSKAQKAASPVSKPAESTAAKSPKKRKLPTQEERDQPTSATKQAKAQAKPKQSPSQQTTTPVTADAMDVGAVAVQSSAKTRRRADKLLPRQQIDIFVADTQRWVPCVVLEKEDGSTKALVQFPNGDCDLIDENETTFRKRYA